MRDHITYNAAENAPTRNRRRDLAIKNRATDSTEALEAHTTTLPASCIDPGNDFIPCFVAASCVVGLPFDDLVVDKVCASLA